MVWSLILIIFCLAIVALIIFGIIIRCDFDDGSMITRENSIINEVLTKNDFPRRTEIVEI